MSDNKSSSGIGFTGLLLLTFIILKLTKYIDWDWWWVLSPIWISVGIAILFILIYLIILLCQKEKPTQKSRWQERLEEMQKQREAVK